MSSGEYSLYIVRCNDGSLYTGIAIDVERRIREHESGSRGAKYLRGKGPLHLVFSAALGDRGTAQQVEYRVKRLERDRKEALIAGQCTLADVAPE
jgi:putative endonuclease